jgi:hypothetical protein
LGPRVAIVPKVGKTNLGLQAETPAAEVSITLYQRTANLTQSL